MKRMVSVACIIALATIQFVTASEVTVGSEEELIQKTALDYGDGFYSGSAERMERALHPDLRKVAPMRLGADGKVILYESTVSGLVEMSRAGVGVIPEAQRKIDLKILKIDGNTACVRFKSSRFNDYLQMLKADGQWRIVNVLWTSGSDVPNRVLKPGFQPESQQEAIKGRARDYMEGVFGDSEGLSRVLHPEFSLANCRMIPNNPNMVVNRIGKEMFQEIVRLKLQPFKSEDQTHEIQILDVMDGLAFVRVESPVLLAYLQLVYREGEWLVVNGLHKPKFTDIKK